ncbi:MAG: endonuclease domain-containing protein [Sphingomonas sp.]
MSLPEARLWQELRKEPNGHHFRRQHPAGPYELDFYCAKAKLCIEVDGEAHARGNRPERDARRDAWLTARGVRTLRIPALEIRDNLDGVLEYILSAVATRG